MVCEYLESTKEIPWNQYGFAGNNYILLLYPYLASVAFSLIKKIPWTEEPGGLQPMGLQRHD